MATQAGVAVVLIVVDLLMVIVGRRLVVLMTKDALKHRVVRRVDVAVGALIPLLAMSAGINREVLCIVIPISRRPGRCTVAVLTLGRKLRGRVIGIGRAVVSRLVA